MSRTLTCDKRKCKQQLGEHCAGQPNDCIASLGLVRRVPGFRRVMESARFGWRSVGNQTGKPETILYRWKPRASVTNRRVLVSAVRRPDYRSASDRPRVAPGTGTRPKAVRRRSLVCPVFSASVSNSRCRERCGGKCATKDDFCRKFGKDTKAADQRRPADRNLSVHLGSWRDKATGERKEKTSGPGRDSSRRV